jgi:hypothetical protein
MNIISRNQIGIFDLPTNLINCGKIDLILTIMSKMVIVKAECLYTPDAIRYTAFSELFAPVECYKEPPYYYIHINTENALEVKIQAERREDQ